MSIGLNGTEAFRGRLYKEIVDLTDSAHVVVELKLRGGIRLPITASAR